MSWSNWEVLERFADNSKLLAILDAGARERLAAMGRRERYAPGQAIVEQGATGNSFYFITDGEVMVLVAEAGEVARLRAGSFFGEMGMLTLQPRSATVVATEPVSVLCFGRSDVLAVLKDYPDAREMVVKVGLARTEENIERIFAGGGEAEVGLSELLEGGQQSDAADDVHYGLDDEAAPMSGQPGSGDSVAAGDARRPGRPPSRDAAPRPPDQSSACKPASEPASEGED